MIEERINNLKPYFRGLKLTDNYRIIELYIKKSWSFNEKEEIQFQKKEVKDNSNMFYYMFYSDTKTFDQILDFIEIDVINYNLEIEEKENLLRAKVEELKKKMAEHEEKMEVIEEKLSAFSNEPAESKTLPNVKFSSEDFEFKNASRYNKMLAKLSKNK